MRWPLRRPRRGEGAGAQEKERSPGKLLAHERGHKWITVGSEITWEWNPFVEVRGVAVDKIRGVCVVHARLATPGWGRTS